MLNLRVIFCMVICIPSRCKMVPLNWERIGFRCLLFNLFWKKECPKKCCACLLLLLTSFFQHNFINENSGRQQLAAFDYLCREKEVRCWIEEVCFLYERVRS